MADDTISQFYDDLANDYDVMTSFEQRFAREKPYFQKIIEQYGIKTALDAGCGTGFHSLLLSKLGVKTTAADISVIMLRRLKMHSKEMKLDITPIHASFEAIDEKITKTFDAIFCLGNSIAHILSNHNLNRTLRNFGKLLNPEGILIMQLLNYDRILRHRKRIVNIKEIDNKTFIRFYDYRKNKIQFNILTLERNGLNLKHKIRSTELRPITKMEITKSLRSTGFTKIKFFGGLDKNKFFRFDSQNLVIFTKKG